MPLRGPEAMEFLRMQASLIVSDSVAIYQSGERLPVLLQKTKKHGTKCLVEHNDWFYEAQSLPGFIGWAKRPEPMPEPSQTASNGWDSVNLISSIKS
jgi:hypothetical protein